MFDLVIFITIICLIMIFTLYSSLIKKYNISLFLISLNLYAMFIYNLWNFLYNSHWMILSFSIASLLYCIIMIIFTFFIMPQVIYESFFLVSISFLVGFILNIVISFAQIYYNIFIANNNAIYLHSLGNIKINFIYFSCMTLTTTGYGDIFPVSNIAKIFCSIEALMGWLLIALILGIIISIINKNFTKLD